METNSQFLEALCAALSRWTIDLTPVQSSQMAKHYEMLIASNKTSNLTRITDPVDAAVLHVADSLALSRWADAFASRELQLLDIGTGAGFPSVPLAIMRPDWQITALDSTGKKITFVREVAAALSLRNLVCEHAHTDHHHVTRKFDVVVSRALGRLSKCIEISNPFLGDNGRVVSYKTPRMSEEERREADAVSRKWRLTTEPPYEYSLDLRGEMHQRELDIRCRKK